MSLTVGSLAAAMGAVAEGDLTLPLDGAAEPGSAGPRHLALALSVRWIEALSQGQARVALVPPGTDWRSLGLDAAILAPRGRLAMARLTQALDVESPAVTHPTAVCEGDARGVTLGAFAWIGAGAEVGAGTRIGAQVTIAPGARIGRDGRIGDGVRIGRNVRIGDRVVIQPGAVIGGDGFSFVTAEPSHVEVARRSLGRRPPPVLADPTWHRIHSLGGVEIGDDVEIGANSTVDAGTIRPTRIGSGTKIDNLVQVGHNVVLGRDCLLCAQAAVAGSTVIGDRTVLGGQAGIGDNLTVGDDVVVTGAAVVLSSVAAGQVVMGYPAQPIAEELARYRLWRRLPALMARLTGNVT